MKPWVSKLRARRTRRWLRQPDRNGHAGRASRWDRPAVGHLVAVGAWLGAAVLLLPTGLPFTPAVLIETLRSQILLLAGFLLAIGLLRVLAPDCLRDNRRLLLLALLSLLAMLPSKGLLVILPRYPSGASWVAPVACALPLTLPPLMAAILIGGRPALVAGLWAAHFCALLANLPSVILLSGLAVSVFVSQASPGVRRRSQVIRIGLLGGISQMLAVQASSAFRTDWAPWLLQGAGLAVFSGLFCGAAAVALLPFFERLFDLASNITLHDLSDLSHPLLQRLAMEAPGTYHHSLVVASLAQSAADEIGANGLLARVAAYYHDIGKLSKPGYFTENMRASESPHDELSPTMSSLLILSHVKEGLSLAMLHRLPRPIQDAIGQHHGTGVVTFFHHKAQQQAAAESAESQGRPADRSTVSDTAFRYPGPKPAGRETAILALADAVEAASRSIEKPTPARIVDAVDAIVRRRFEDGQLDDCELTFAELNRVKRSFVTTLNNILHSRIAYPSTHENPSPRPFDCAPNE